MIINCINPKEPYKIGFLFLCAIFSFSNLGSASSATADQAVQILIRTPISGKDDKQVWRAGLHSRRLPETRQKMKMLKHPRRRLEGSCGSVLGFPQSAISTG